MTCINPSIGNPAYRCADGFCTSYRGKAATRLGKHRASNAKVISKRLSQHPFTLLANRFLGRTTPTTDSYDASPFQKIQFLQNKSTIPSQNDDPFPVSTAAMKRTLAIEERERQTAILIASSRLAYAHSPHSLWLCCCCRLPVVSVAPASG
jgi:hypothetical protein